MVPQLRRWGGQRPAALRPSTQHRHRRAAQLGQCSGDSAGGYDRSYSSRPAHRPWPWKPIGCASAGTAEGPRQQRWPKFASEFRLRIRGMGLDKLAGRAILKMSGPPVRKERGERHPEGTRTAPSGLTRRNGGLQRKHSARGRTARRPITGPEDRKSVESSRQIAGSRQTDEAGRKVQQSKGSQQTESGGPPLGEYAAGNRSALDGHLGFFCQSAGHTTTRSPSPRRTAATASAALAKGYCAVTSDRTFTTPVAISLSAFS